ncbi:hypothetical protein L873DRAFT_1175984 [Choiromyces venosus 120613-1]|uniref:Uncharacterized protein n=1 Tax=Choiromyces venosus 120613-1 TaxID=1336337 RepID=A0A3N4K6L4_9PEZI|nr:hypothetical protein L873DRAFT_1175984 [Choiromyces venosus 120613-1]
MVSQNVSQSPYIRKSKIHYEILLLAAPVKLGFDLENLGHSPHRSKNLDTLIFVHSLSLDKYRTSLLIFRYSLFSQRLRSSLLFVPCPPGSIENLQCLLFPLSFLYVSSTIFVLLLRVFRNAGEYTIYIAGLYLSVPYMLSSCLRLNESLQQLIFTVFYLYFPHLSY